MELAIRFVLKPKAMKTTIRNAAATIICSLLLNGLTAQENISMENKTIVSNDYSNAIGLRFGGISGITYKHRFQSNAVEVIAGTYPYSFGLTGLYERYSSTTVNGLNLYYGAGAHISRAYYTSWTYFNIGNDRYGYYKTYNYYPIFGLDIIGGIEYKIPKAPLAISLDLKPYVDFFREYGPYGYIDPGLGIKFTF